MSRPKPPANDHLAAFGKTGDDLDRLTDAEIEARLKTQDAALSRALKLESLRLGAQSLARLEAAARKDHP